MYILDNFIVDFSYKNKKNITILQVLLTNFNFSEDIINSVIERIDEKSVYILDTSFLADLCLYCKTNAFMAFLEKLEKMAGNKNFHENVITFYKDKNSLNQWSNKIPSFISDINDNDHISLKDKQLLVDKFHKIMMEQLNIFELEQKIYEHQKIKNDNNIKTHMKNFKNNISEKIDKNNKEESNGINLEEDSEVNFLLANID